MGHLRTSLGLLLLFCSLWPSDGRISLTHLGTKCTEDCKSDAGEYKCKSIDKDGRCETMFCSPKEKFDYWNRECRNRCGTYGVDYYWCKIDNLFSWGYCGQVIEDKNHYGSQTGALCYDNCDQRKQDYYWCHTAQGWDYCSPSEHRDYKNRQCREDNSCGKQGNNYNWCWLKEGNSWGYCGLVEPKMLLHRSTEHYNCIDKCQYYERGDYYWCHTAYGWDYCSPDVDVTYKGKPCRSDHSCDSFGYNYNWCWTSESDYDYCGPIESGECTYVPSKHRKRRALEGRKLICTQEDKHKKKITTFTADPAPNVIAEGSPWRNEAENLISRWDNHYLMNDVRLNLIQSNNLRIDLYRIIERNHQPHYDLRIHVKQSPGQNTTVSQILVPRGIPHRYVRRAFRESFINQAPVSVDVSGLK